MGVDQSSVLAFAKLLEPKRVVGFNKIRVGGRHDGGYVMIDDFSDVDDALSLGVGHDASWDLDVARRNIEVHQFDHSIDRSPVDHDLITFHKTRVAEADGRGALCLDSIADVLICDSQRCLLKMDIEGDEWFVLNTASPTTLSRFKQVACEFHDLGRLADPFWYHRFLTVMTKLKEQFEVVHVHGNNFLTFAVVANVVLPVVVEVTFASREHYQFAETDEIFPTTLDCPNYPGVPDLYLGSFKF